MALPVEDVLAIQQLFNRFLWVLDMEGAPEEELLAMFTEDAYIVGPARGRYEGREGQRAFAEQQRNSRYGAVGAGRNRHVVTNQQVVGDGDEATMRVYGLGFRTELTEDPRTTRFLLSCHYDCEVRRVDGEWKFAGRTAFYDTISGTNKDKSNMDHSEIPHVVVPL